MSSNQKFILNQKDNYNMNFGHVFRSAATFYLINDPRLKTKTTLSFFNYWKHKNNFEVQIMANVRKLNGALIKRELLSFEDGEVINYTPFTEEFFEGSVEIEIFSLKNLRIPYPAVIVIYESPSMFTLTHTYGRTYSQHELEDKRIVPFGAEAGWTIRDSEKVNSFCVMHNGGKECPKQKMSLVVRRVKDDRAVRAEIDVPSLRPYETLKIYPGEHISNLKEFLRDDIGNASLDFKLADAFTRLMVGTESKDKKEFQVTHSNFNYNKIGTDILAEENPTVIFPVPKIDAESYNLLIYPNMTDGDYSLRKNGQTLREFNAHDFVKIPVKGGEKVNIERKEHGFPSRLVLGLEFSYKDANFVSECSLNILHSEKAPKRYHWGPANVHSNVSSILQLEDLSDIFGGFKQNNEIVLRFYSSRAHDYLERKFMGEEALLVIQNGFSLNDDSEILEFFDSQPGWWSIWSSYPGFLCYVHIIDFRSGHSVLEHAF